MEVTCLPVLSVLFKIVKAKMLGKPVFFMRVGLIYRKKGLCICCPLSFTVTNFMTLHSWNLQLVVRSLNFEFIDNLQYPDGRPVFPNFRGHVVALSVDAFSSP